MTGPILSELAKALAGRLEHHVSGGLLHDVAKGLLESPREAKVSAEAKQLQGNRQGIGNQQAVEVKVPPPAPSRDPVPILKQILRILQTIGMKIGIAPKPAPGTPPPMPLGTQFRQLGESVRLKAHQFIKGERNTGGNAGFHLKQIGAELARKRGITFAEAVPKKAAAAEGAGAAGIGRAIIGFSRLAGVVGIVTGALGLLYGAARDFVSGIVEQNRELAKYNAAIAASFSRLEVTKMRLQVQQGAATEGTATMLNDQLESLLTEVQPIRQAAGQVVNMLGSLLVLAARGVVLLVSVEAVLNALLPLPGLADAAKKLLEEIAKGNAKGAPLNILGDLQKQRQAAAIQPLPGQGKKPQFIQPLPARRRK